MRWSCSCLLSIYDAIFFFITWRWTWIFSDKKTHTSDFLLQSISTTSKTQHPHIALMRKFQVNWRIENKIKDKMGLKIEDSLNYSSIYYKHKHSYLVSVYSVFLFYWIFPRIWQATCGTKKHNPLHLAWEKSEHLKP